MVIAHSLLTSHTWRSQETCTYVSQSLKFLTSALHLLSVHIVCLCPQSMAEQLAENYHNTWGRKKKMELQSKGKDISKKKYLPHCKGVWSFFFFLRRRWNPSSSGPLWHPDSKRKGPRPREGVRAAEVPAAEWIRCHEVFMLLHSVPICFTSFSGSESGDRRSPHARFILKSWIHVSHQGLKGHGVGHFLHREEVCLWFPAEAAEMDGDSPGVYRPSRYSGANIQMRLPW